MRWITRERPEVDRVACPEDNGALAHLAVVVRGADTARPDVAPREEEHSWNPQRSPSSVHV
jgi:hypothetical protein